ncbi:MAG: phage tail protein [Lachnospiraceae bacterium]|nr:phage tail protein [Lachnospiraceae bacterium]
MAWTGLTLTVEGRNALNQAQLAGRIQFKSIVVGDGAAPVNFRTLKKLVHQLYEITDIKVDMTEDGCTVTADFPKVDYDYYFREIGIIVTTDEGDRLYVYDNCGEDAQYMVSSTGVETTKKRIRLALAISDVEEITVSAAEILYVAYDDYENTIKNLKQDLQEENERAQTAEETNKNSLVNHVSDKTNPHKVTKAQVGLGNVDNTADMDKPVSTAQQEALDRHTENNAVHITEAERTNWNDANTKKHTHNNKGVLDKITQALLDSWNAAYTHISDAVKHVTAAERTLWNTVSNKVDKVSGKGLSSNDYTTAEKNKLSGIAANANNYTHPTTAGNKHIPSGGSSGQMLRWGSDGTAVWGNDIDTKVEQVSTTANADTRLLLSNNANSVTETNRVKKSDNFLANPATGEFYAKGYRRIILDGKTLNVNTLTLSSGYPMIEHYIERTDGGSSNITNIPISGKPFLLDVELIRWASASDYITMQTFRNASDYTHEYVRICTNGTWSAWQKRIFTDTNTTYSAATQSTNGLLSAADKKKLDGIAANANNYVHPTTAGNKHIPAGGSSGQILRWSSDGTAAWGSDNNTTYSTATQSANGLLSSADKKKLDGISEGANKVIVDSALSSTSANPVQNKVINSALGKKMHLQGIENITGSSYEKTINGVVSGDILFVSAYGSGGTTAIIFVYSPNQMIVTGFSGVQTSFRLCNNYVSVTISNGAVTISRSGGITGIYVGWLHIGNE